jgi:hypothetical protein
MKRATVQGTTILVDMENDSTGNAIDREIEAAIPSGCLEEEGW